MRKSGSSTRKKCWKLIVIDFRNEVILSKDYSTMREIADELGYTYNIVNDMFNGRTKGRKGRYDTRYEIIKLGQELELSKEVIIDKETIQEVS